jgi:hypothetical protein
MIFIRLNFIFKGSNGTSNYTNKYNFSKSSGYYEPGVFVVEVFIVILVLTLWLISIILCLAKYKKLRTLEPISQPYNINPMRIEQGNFMI